MKIGGSGSVQALNQYPRISVGGGRGLTHLRHYSNPANSFFFGVGCRYVLLSNQKYSSVAFCGGSYGIYGIIPAYVEM